MLKVQKMIYINLNLLQWINNFSIEYILMLILQTSDGTRKQTETLASRNKSAIKIGHNAIYLISRRIVQEIF